MPRVSMRQPGCRLGRPAFLWEMFFTNKTESMKRVIAKFTVCATALILLVFLPSITVAEDDFGDDCATAQLMALNSSVSGNIDFEGDFDYFRVEVLEPGILTVWTLNSPAINSYGYLYDANCLLIAENDKRIGSNGFGISHYATPGTYFIAVRHESGTETNYILQANFTPGVIPDEPGYNCATAEALAPNSSMAGNIHYAGDFDYFKVVVPESGLLTAETIDPTAIDSYGYLYDSNCLLIAEHNNISDKDDNFQISRPVAAGNYYVAVRHYNTLSGTGGYTLQVEFETGELPDDYGNSCATAEPIALNSSMPGNIDYGTDYDYFSVEVLVNGLLTVGTVDPPETAIDTYGYLYDSNCSLIEENDDIDPDADNYNFQISHCATAGDYFVAVRHYDLDIGIGAYTMQVDFTPVPGDINLDCAVDLADVLLILQITTGFMPENIAFGADVNGDGKIDLTEALYDLQIIAGIRP